MTTTFTRAALLAAVLGACTKSGGTATPAPAPATRTTADFTPQLLARGDSIFHASSCSDCHGRTGKGSPHGPSLVSGRFAQTDGSYDQIVKVITTGVPEDQITNPSFPEPMPVRGGDKPPLTDEQIRALAAYVYRLSHP